MGRSADLSALTIIMKGAGDVASGIAHRLHSARFHRLLLLEIGEPLCVRRTVSFSEAVYRGAMEVEGVKAELVRDIEDLEEVWKRKSIAVMVDPRWTAIEIIKPRIVVDAIMAKRNIGTTTHEAPTVIGVGPGFTAPLDVHVVIESKRGHDLGKAIYDGSAEAYTGVPGSVMGYATERVLRSPVAGPVKAIKKIGDRVAKGELVLYVGDVPVYGSFDGVLRGLIREIEVTAGEKIGDVDPRGIGEYCYTISDKARAIGGGVLEAVLHAVNL
ncbi:MAG TPA: selenium-dependent molybdenum cofactor biosynthesis protein YqeB [Syntrophorhabdaceae bacterium]|jgi:xanthine dehydrogenase accessory factor